MIVLGVIPIQILSHEMTRNQAGMFDLAVVVGQEIQDRLDADGWTG